MLASDRRGMAALGSFGHDGLGGHLGFAHPGTGIAFAYQNARPGGVPDDRAEALSRALPRRRQTQLDVRLQSGGTETRQSYPDGRFPIISATRKASSIDCRAFNRGSQAVS